MINVKNLQKNFGGVEVLKGITTEIDKGDVICVIGPSGSGKSTFLRCLNMLERPSGGQIIFEGDDLTDKKIDLDLHRQKMGMVFQQFNLFPHMTVLENLIEEPIQVKGMKKAEILPYAKELLEKVGLADRADYYPSQLSGGQQQRVAIARALACDPEYILCDEATSALDPASTQQILDLLRQINEETGTTILVITHSMDVVERICKNVTVLVHGHVVEQGPVERIFADPQDETTKALLGRVSWNA